eukprot:4586894-Pleurochrysis_carterae.AAC.2
MGVARRVAVVVVNAAAAAAAVYRPMDLATLGPAAGLEPDPNLRTSSSPVHVYALRVYVEVGALLRLSHSHACVVRAGEAFATHKRRESAMASTR